MVARRRRRYTTAAAAAAAAAAVYPGVVKLQLSPAMARLRHIVVPLGVESGANREEKTDIPFEGVRTIPFFASVPTAAPAAAAAVAAAFAAAAFTAAVAAAAPTTTCATRAIVYHWARHR